MRAIHYTDDAVTEAGNISLIGSHTGFRSVPKPRVTVNGPMAVIRRYALFHTIRQLSEPTASNSLKLDSGFRQCVVYEGRRALSLSLRQLDLL